ncbi:MAG: methyltransferase domain-containing protein [Dehalococcoidia bacterium]|nr:methyltransferase domain-containing protein [Dehalococcoidia bacterium]
MATRSGHRGFAAFWDWMSRHEPQKEHELRGRVAGGCRGQTLEFGFGVGANWSFLPPDVDYVGIEPDAYMRTRAAQHERPRTSSFDLRNGDAQALEFPDASVDTILGTLVFCTIPDAAAALREARRVLRPDGQLRFCEHVRPAGRVTGRAMDVLAPPWSRLAGGCHPNRRTLETIERAGFELTEIEHTKIGPLPAILGVARPRLAAAAHQEG